MSAECNDRKRNSMLVGVSRHIDAGKRDVAIKYISLAVLVVQNAAQVLVMRYVRTRPREMFLSTVAVFCTEVVKLISCFVLITVAEKGFLRCLKLMHRDIIKQPIDTLKVCVPAVIYVIQNNLLYVAVSNLSAATYMVTYQLKILTTALFTVLILRRRLSVLQWLALVLLFGGVALVQVDEKKAKDTAKFVKENATLVTDSNFASTKSTDTYKHIGDQSPVKGFSAVIVACILSGFSGIYLEKILKGSDVSVWMRNVQLAIISLPVGLANIFIQDSEKVLERGILIGFDIVVWGMIFLSSLGGLFVAVVIKYADNILKAFATSISIIIACVVSTLFFQFRPSILFLTGTILVIGAIFMYSLFPFTKQYQKAPTDPPQVAQRKPEAAAL
ncbi:unnamed protein product [Thelazia callipaeda]|uniref:UDP-galactose transporter n=1 Tax=Thelazia callipaeda TaxID=103827 RepID=A0A0N5CQQ4_THECL|nr:unnamed protein product [Thelazia callipaeda]